MPEPLESPLLAQLRDGDTFCDGVWRLSNALLRQAKNGSYLTCQLNDSSGSRQAKAWKVSGEQFETIKDAPFIRASGRVDNAPGYCGQIVLESFAALACVDDDARFQMPLPGQHRAHQARFRELISSVRRSELKALLKQVFDSSGDIWPRFADAPAAMNHHHNYRGGLLEHCGEVALLSDRAAGALCGVDRDLLVCAALLHDIGKIDELDCDFSSGQIKYTHAGELVGHVVLGAQIIARAADSIQGFPLRLRTEVTHLILSHHGEPEWGAARRPMCAEALILSQCDNLSAKIAACRGGCESTTEDDFARASGWHSLPHAPQNRVYVGRMRELNGE
jgi:3'-5' exoribonuclease